MTMIGSLGSSLRRAGTSVLRSAVGIRSSCVRIPSRSFSSPSSLLPLAASRRPLLLFSATIPVLAVASSSRSSLWKHFSTAEPHRHEDGTVCTADHSHEEKIVDAQPAPPVDSERAVGVEERKQFQAETRELLNIVANSLYTDKEVFIRELVSNASDALERRRHRSLVDGLEPEKSEIRISTRAENDEHQIVIHDTGIGMNKTELENHLGTIARSGSKAFVADLLEKNSGSDVSDKIIGRFGVGFYSAFMVANKITVFTRSAVGGEDSIGYCWESDGSGTYTIREADGVSVGTKIIMHLKPECSEFANAMNVETIVKKYSNFVGFPILLNGNQVNTVQAVWHMSKNDISEQQHLEFYRFISNGYDEPLMRLHFQTDSPISIKSIFYVPSSHSEKMGLGRQEFGVNLMSRKVLIKPKSKEILPEFLRFLKGVVDSEDIPLNISRENMQDSQLIRKINTVLTKRILKWFSDEAKFSREAYNRFFGEYGHFLKEGICMHPQFKDELVPLVRFESSTGSSGELTSLDEVIDRFNSNNKNESEEQEKPSQPPRNNNIYYLSAPNRQAALSSPYYEIFKKNGVEVLFLYNPVDLFVMTQIGLYRGFRTVTAEGSELEADVENGVKKDLNSSDNKDGDKNSSSSSSSSSNESSIVGLNSEENVAFSLWLKDILKDQVSDVKVSSRLVDSPAIVLDSRDNAALRRMMRMFDDKVNEGLPKQILEFNPNHSVIVGLNGIRESKPDLAKVVAEQILDNALIAAGLMDDCRPMLSRLTSIMSHAVKKQ